MTTCLGKSCSFGLLLALIKVCVCILSLLAGGLWDVIVLIPDRILYWGSSGEILSNFHGYADIKVAYNLHTHSIN